MDNNAIVILRSLLEAHRESDEANWWDHNYENVREIISKSVGDCDTCDHDGECYITALKCKGYVKASSICDQCGRSIDKDCTCSKYDDFPGCE